MLVKGSVSMFAGRKKRANVWEVHSEIEKDVQKKDERLFSKVKTAQQVMFDKYKYIW